MLDVSNDPGWLKLRLERFPGPFRDRVVLWVDGREIRPTSEQYIDAPRTPNADRPLATYRMRGTMPLDAKTLRWYYGLVIDPYPMTIRRADGKIIVEEIAGDAWSETIDLRGQFAGSRSTVAIAGVLIAVAMLIPGALRVTALLRR